MFIETDYRALAHAGKEGLPLRIAGGVVAIGNFDGVHRGHQALLGEAKKMADAKGLKLTALTFSPHPRLYFNAQQPPFLLTDKAQRQEFLHRAGADAVVDLAFDALLAGLTAAEFVENVLWQGLAASHVVVGENFHFGAKRQGNVALLTSLGETHGMAVTAIGLTGEAGERISSERIRDALRHGHVASAETLLGRPWEIRSEVVRGQKLGRTLGYPTANLELGAYVHPAFGVYRGRAVVDGAAYKTAISIGVRPTVNTGKPLLEAYLLDFDGNLYGKEIAIELLDYLRPEQKFGDLKALTAQIEKDVALVKGF